MTMNPDSIQKQWRKKLNSVYAVYKPLYIETYFHLKVTHCDQHCFIWIKACDFIADMM